MAQQDNKKQNGGSNQGQSSVTPIATDDIKSSTDAGDTDLDLGNVGDANAPIDTTPPAGVTTDPIVDTAKVTNDAAAAAEEEAKKKAAADAKKEADAAKNANALGLSDVIKVTITRADMSLNGSALLAVESIIDILLLYPYAQIEVKPAHVAAIYNYIKDVKRTKKFATIAEKARALAIVNWKTKYGIKD